MLEKFFPDTVVNRFTDITLDILKKHRIDAVILDIDNTLVPYETEEPTQEVIDWLQELTTHGIKACIVSNAQQQRAEKFNDKIKLACVSKARKPSTKGFLKATELMKVQPYQTAVIGDQIFTDIYGGKRSNMFAILVKPISNKEIWPIRLKRVLEVFILYRYRKTKGYIG